MKVYKEGDYTIIDFEGATLKGLNNHVAIDHKELEECKVKYKNITFEGFAVANRYTFTPCQTGITGWLSAEVKKLKIIFKMVRRSRIAKAKWAVR